MTSTIFTKAVTEKPCGRLMYFTKMSNCFCVYVMICVYIHEDLLYVIEKSVLWSQILAAGVYIRSLKLNGKTLKSLFLLREIPSDSQV